MAEYGLGWHAEDIDPTSYDKLEHLGAGTGFTTITAGYVSKLSFFITLLRLVSGWQRKAPLWFFMTTCCLSYFVLSIIQPFYQCNPRKPWRTNCIDAGPIDAFQVYVSIYGTIVVSHVAPDPLRLLRAMLLTSLAGFSPLSCANGGHPESEDAAQREDCDYLCDEHWLIVSFKAAECTC